MRDEDLEPTIEPTHPGEFGLGYERGLPVAQQAVSPLATTLADDLDEQLRGLSPLAGHPLGELLHDERFDQLIMILESPDLGVDGYTRQRLLQQIEQRRSQVFGSTQQAFTLRLELGDLDEAEVLLERARRIDAEAVIGLEVMLRQARHRAEEAIARRRHFEDALKRAQSNRFDYMRDARAMLESLLSQHEVPGLDHDQVRRALDRLQTRMDFEMAEQAATHTRMLLEHLKPKLQALGELYALRKRGEHRFHGMGDRAEPLPAAIDRLEYEIGPMLARQVGEDLTGTQRLADDGEAMGLRAALRRLHRYKAFWHLLEPELFEQVRDCEEHLQVRLDRLQQIDKAVESALALMEEDEDTGRAIEFIELSRTRIGGEIPRLDKVLDTIRRHRVLPMINRIDDLAQRAGRLTGLYARQLDDLLARTEAMERAISTTLPSGEDSHGLRGRHSDLLALLRGYVEARALQNQGRFEPARMVLEALARSLPEYADVVQVQLDGLSIDRSVEETLAEVRHLYGRDPERALALARQHVASDARFREFTDHATVDHVMTRAHELERRGEYQGALDVLQGVWGQLSSDRNPRLEKAIRHMTAVHRDATSVADLLEKLEACEPGSHRDMLATRLGEFAVGLDRADAVNALLAAQVPRKLHALRAGLAHWRRTGDLDLAQLEADARFLRLRVQPPGPELAHLLREYDFAVVLLEARQTLFASAFDEAEQLVSPYLAGPFGNRAKAFIVRCRAQRALARSQTALAELDMEAARAELQSAPTTDVQVQAAKLFIERFGAAIGPLVEPDATADDSRHVSGADDSIEAFRLARALIEEQEPSPAFQQALVRLGRVRIACTRRRIDREPTHVPGQQIARMAWLTRDFEAAGVVEAEFGSLVQQVHARAASDLRALFTWVVERETQLDATPVGDARLVVERLRVAHRLDVQIEGLPDRSEISEYLSRAEHLCHRIQAFEIDRQQVAELLEASRKRGDRSPLQRAVEIESSYADLVYPFDAKPHLQAWENADECAARIAERIQGGALAEAMGLVDELVQLCDRYPLPHAERLSIHRADGRTMGPGAAVVIEALSAEIETCKARRAKLVMELAGYEEGHDAFEARRASLLHIAVRERDRGEADDLARQLAAEAGAVSSRLRALRPEARRLGIGEQVQALQSRFGKLSHDALGQEIQQRRRDVDAAVDTLNRYRSKGERIIHRHMEEIKRLGELYPESVRVTRFVRHFHLLLAGGAARGPSPAGPQH